LENHNGQEEAGKPIFEYILTWYNRRGMVYCMGNSSQGLYCL